MTETPAPAAIVPPIVAWYREHGRDLPWRRDGFPAWGTLVSEFMLQQTQVSRVVPRLEAWLERWPTPAALAAEPASEALRAWAGLGYPRRALWLHRAAGEIVEHHGGVVPRDVDALLALAGVGDYTARAVAVFAYGDRHPVVDTNTRRVIARAAHGLAEPGAPARADLAAMDAILPEGRDDAAAANAALMELGALVCTARSPDCEACPIADRCAWVAAGSPPSTAAPRRRQPAFEGSDRQARGRLLASIGRARTPVTAEELASVWPDAPQRERAIASLLADGLAVAQDGGFVLPE